MKPQLRFFRSLAMLTSLVEEYFNSVGIDATTLRIKDEAVSKPAAKKRRSAKQAIKVETKPPTITGLALHLGFNSLEEFEQYEKVGRFATTLKRARLLIAATYEKKLHNTHHGGAVFALKEMGWHERADEKYSSENAPVITIKIIES